MHLVDDAARVRVVPTDADRANGFVRCVSDDDGLRADAANLTRRPNDAKFGIERLQPGERVIERTHGALAVVFVDGLFPNVVRGDHRWIDSADLEHMRKPSRRTRVQRPFPKSDAAGFVCQCDARREHVAAAFGVLALGDVLKDAIAEQIRSAVGGLDIIRETEVLGRVTVSIGIAYAADVAGIDQATPFSTADGCLYEANDRGRNQVISAGAGPPVVSA